MKEYKFVSKVRKVGSSKMITIPSVVAENIDNDQVYQFSILLEEE